jgi:hypothetical protein
MITSPPVAWLWATFDKRRRYYLNHDFQNRAWMITLKSVMDAGPAAHTCRSDYDDPLRWWL